MSWMEKVKTIWIVSVCLTTIAVVGMVTGNVEVTFLSTGALAGWVGGNRNGQRSE